MTERQKFVLDLKGWLLLPSLLTHEQSAACREHILAIDRDPESLPKYQRNSYTGPCGNLLDRPAIVDVLREVISPDLSHTWLEMADRNQPEQSTAYGFRCDNSFRMVRTSGNDVPRNPHNGGPGMGPSHNYDFVNGAIFSPSVRVAWELSPVE